MGGAAKPGDVGCLGDFQTTPSPSMAPRWRYTVTFVCVMMVVPAEASCALTPILCSPQNNSDRAPSQ